MNPFSGRRIPTFNSTAAQYINYYWIIQLFFSFILFPHLSLCLSFCLIFQISLFFYPMSFCIISICLYTLSYDYLWYYVKTVFSFFVYLYFMQSLCFRANIFMYLFLSLSLYVFFAYLFLGFAFLCTFFYLSMCFKYISLSDFLLVILSVFSLCSCLCLPVFCFYFPTHVFQRFHFLSFCLSVYFRLSIAFCCYLSHFLLLLWPSALGRNVRKLFLWKFL